MIPLYKLEKLPRTQKLRKIAKVFIMAENRLRALQGMTAGELAFLKDAAKLLSGDPLFPPQAHVLFGEAADLFSRAAEPPTFDAPALLRALNGVKHLLLAETGREQADWDFTSGDGSLNPAARQVFEGMQVYLEDIRSPFNVGAMFRTAESFGVEKIILSPFTADPGHRRAQRTAMGCIDIIPWERQQLFAKDSPPPPCPVFALETGGTPIAEFPFPEKGILIAGSEELGVSPLALEAADASLGRVSIPCFGAKASLNVSVAFGIALQAWAAKKYQYLPIGDCHP
jgi:TrmH family RNA methyltransferase